MLSFTLNLHRPNIIRRPRDYAGLTTPLIRTNIWVEIIVAAFILGTYFSFGAVAALVVAVLGLVVSLALRPKKKVEQPATSTH